MLNRSSGILLHISSLPGEYGIGGFGESAKEFIDFLSETGCKHWQVLPFTPADDYNSPYSSVSAFAGNINFIDLPGLNRSGLLTNAELEKERHENVYVAAYEELRDSRKDTLCKAYKRADNELRQKIKEYTDKNSYWLEDYALYSVIKAQNNGMPWYDWDYGYKLRSPAALDLIKDQHREEIDFIGFCQFIFDLQWSEIREYAAKKGILIIGDMPIYVSLDSADVWSHPDLFDLDEKGRAINVAGVPPDYFSADGQKWGQALYNWDKMAEENYNWWMQRLQKTFELYDLVRIDHFRAFAAYWAVPAESETAKNGKWISGPGGKFFDEVFKNFSRDRIIAEDLGEIDDSVRELLAETRLPGMRVIQFAFLSFSDNLHLPHNYEKNSFAYTGTHDNNTLLGWLWEAAPEQRRRALDYCGFCGDEWSKGGSDSEAIRAVIRTVWQSHANVSIVPLQDLLGYGSDTRMNIPGVAEDNWRFRVTKEQLGQIDKSWLKALNEIYMR